jgi:hypothetical protein
MIFTILNNPVCRRRMHHRLMVGTSINVMGLCIPQLWGSAAVPEDNLYMSEARGNATTCSAIGFLFQFFGFSVPSYYAALSILAFVGVTNDYHLEKYAHVEKWIHIGVHVFPLGSAIYLLQAEAFNYSGHSCWIESEPLGCGDGSDVVCTRGPQNIGLYQWVFAGLPVMLLLLVPTILMFTLYLDVRRRQKEIRIEAKVVALQSAWYLLALYWTYSFSFVNGALLVAAGQHVFSMTLVAASVESLLGFWILLAYLRFREPPTRPSEDEGEARRKIKPPVATEQVAMSATTCSHSVSSFFSTVPRLDADDESTRQALRVNRSEEVFSIFDGTNGSSKWSKFVFDGDISDEDEDDLEALKWEGVLQT